MCKKANVHTVRTGWRGSGRLAGVIADLVTNVDRFIVAVVVMTTATVLNTVITVVIITAWESNVGISSMTTATVPTTAITVVIITV